MRLRPPRWKPHPILRLLTPRLGERLPHRDTGGAPETLAPSEWYRPAQKQQNPDIDAAEPTNESAAAGEDHGWSGCTMSAGAMALDFHTLGAIRKWGGDLRHSGQPDMSGGTDLYDLQIAWSMFGETLEIRSGSGWDALRKDRSEGRAIILQGSGNVPGSATYDGGHCICVLPETHSDGRWLQADPLCTGPEWVNETDLQFWASDFSTSIAYARTAPHLPEADVVTGSDDVMFNVAPMTTHRDLVVMDGTILYSDSALTKRHSVATGDTLMAFAGSVGEAYVVINSGYTNYIRRDSICTIVANDRTFE